MPTPSISQNSNNYISLLEVQHNGGFVVNALKVCICGFAIMNWPGFDFKISIIKYNCDSGGGGAESDGK